MWSLAAPKYCSLLTNGAIILIDIRDFGRQEWRWRREILKPQLVPAGTPWWEEVGGMFSLICVDGLIGIQRMLDLFIVVLLTCEQIKHAHMEYHAHAGMNTNE